MNRNKKIETDISQKTQMHRNKNGTSRSHCESLSLQETRKIKQKGFFCQIS